MSKPIAELICYCGNHILVTPEDLGFEELECGACETLNSCPETVEAIEAQNNQTLHEIAERNKATHVRIMARGEDNHVWCIRNMVANDDLLDVIIDGFKVRHPEATIWPEDEEATNAGYLDSLMRELHY